METLRHILHHNNHVPAQGGVETLLSIHREHEGKRSAMIGFRSPARVEIAQAGTGLGARPRTPIWKLRERYRNAASELGPFRFSLFHNLWGLSMVADLDPSLMRGGFIHSDFPCFNGMVRRLAPLLDFLVNNSPVLHERCRELLPGWDESRFIRVPQPIDWSHLRKMPTEGESPVDPVPVIGIACRITKAQKQMHRLPELLGALDRLLPAYRMEVLGDGDYLGILKRRLESRRNVHFHGWVDSRTPEYWAILRRWTYTVSMSRYESLALSVLEAAGAGAIPVYPDFHDGKDFWPKLDTRFVYPVNDLEAAARRIADWQEMKVASRAAVCESLHTIPQRFNRDGYLLNFDAGLRKLEQVGPRRERQDVCLHPSWGTLTFHNFYLKRLRFGPWGWLWHI